MNHFHKRICYDKENNYKIVSDELIANLFRISQTEQRLKKDNVDTEKKLVISIIKLEKWLEKQLKKQDGTMPEDLPTPKKSLKQLEKENNKSLKN